MNAARYITVQAIKTSDNKLIPLWDKSIKYDCGDCGDYLLIDGERKKYFTVVDVIYDIKTQTISRGIDIDYYPDNISGFNVGEYILVESKYKYLREATITDIVYEEFDLNIIKGNKIEENYGKSLPIEKIDDSLLYSVKQWKPFYVLDDGSVIKYNHEMYHKA